MLSFLPITASNDRQLAAFPRLAYPTYEVGARLARAEYVAYSLTPGADAPGPTDLPWWAMVLIVNHA